MRILDQDADKSINQITLYLTVLEAQELRDSIDSLLQNETHHHEHISSEDYKKEITMTIYDRLPLDSFDERSKKIVLSHI